MSGGRLHPKVVIRCAGEGGSSVRIPTNTSLHLPSPGCAHVTKKGYQPPQGREDTSRHKRHSSRQALEHQPPATPEDSTNPTSPTIARDAREVQPPHHPTHSTRSSHRRPADQTVLTDQPRYFCSLIMANLTKVIGCQ